MLWLAESGGDILLLVPGVNIIPVTFILVTGIIIPLTSSVLIILGNSLNGGVWPADDVSPVSQLHSGLCCQSNISRPSFFGAPVSPWLMWSVLWFGGAYEGSTFTWFVARAIPMSLVILVTAWVVFCITYFMLGNFKMVSLIPVNLYDTSSGRPSRFIVYCGIYASRHTSHL